MKPTIMGLTLTAAALTTISGCADSPLQPVARRVATANPAVASANVPRHVVEFKGSPGKDFAAQVAALGGTVDYVVESLGFAGVSGLSGDALSALGRQGGVGSVYEDTPVQLDAQSTIGAIEAADVSPASIANPAGAIRFNYQWNMRVIGANTAWAAGRLGSPDVTAAILDTGIDYDGYDMNGMVDLARSTSFVPGDNAFIAALLPTRNQIEDLNGHGSNVATQVSSNGTIFAGVNSRARLIGVKVLGASGSGTLGGILAGIVWAADHGADVANMSLGISGGVDKAGNGSFVGLTNKVFNYANHSGMVIVVSAGNDAQDLDNSGRTFSAYCEASHVICVSATGPTASTNAFSGPWTNVDQLASYSNFGRQAITVSAPGGTSRGWVASVCARHLVQVSPAGVVSYPCNAPAGFFVALGFAGTSQASPHVTGVVAQLIAKYGKKNPSQIKHLLLQQGVDDLGPAGADAAYGAGRVNLAKALGL